MELTTGGRRFADLCRDLFTLAQDSVAQNAASRGPSRGWRWEARIADVLAYRGFPVDARPGVRKCWAHCPLRGYGTRRTVHCNALTRMSSASGNRIAELFQSMS